MQLNFVNNIIFPEWIERYDEEEIAIIKQEAQVHGRNLAKYSNRTHILKRGIELSKSTKYEKLNPVQKLIFISNVVFKDDENFINKMSKYGWTKEKNQELNNLILKIKSLQKQKCEINLDVSLIEEIEDISLVCFGIKNPAILINRLNELTVTKKEELNHSKKY